MTHPGALLLLFNKREYLTEDELKVLLEELLVSQTTVLMNYKNLSLDFCLDYLLNEDYSKSDRDEYLDIYDVIKYQPQLRDKIKFV